MEQQRRRRRRRRRRRQYIVRQRILLGMVCMVLAIGFAIILNFAGRYRETAYSTKLESSLYSHALYQETLYASSLCTGISQTSPGEYGIDTQTLTSAAVFDINNHQTLYADSIFETRYPASMTKLMTAFLALKYGNLDDVVTVGKNATVFEPEAVLCGLREGDRITLYDLLCGLLLPSGNDNGVAIAEHISGSVEDFAALMNKEAWQLGATHSHFMNPHGLHEEEHYTTAYDLYLIFQACLQDSRFLDIISMESYTATITSADGTVRQSTWYPTNYYTSGNRSFPEGVQIIGGKTGTTNEAGSCLILYSLYGENQPYISIVTGADSKAELYENMDLLLSVPATIENTHSESIGD